LIKHKSEEIEEYSDHFYSSDEEQYSELFYSTDSEQYSDRFEDVSINSENSFDVKSMNYEIYSILEQIEELGDDLDL